jgi:hypothetical protein
MNLILYLAGFTLLMALFIWWSLRLFGKWYMKLVEEYEKQYNYIELFLRECKCDLASFHELRRLFADIERYSCKNREKISVLKYQFLNKFFKLIKSQAHEKNTR